MSRHCLARKPVAAPRCSQVPAVRGGSMAMFFLLRHNGKHKSALLDTIDFARDDGPCPQMAAERPHDVFLQRCPETFHNIWKRRHTVSLVLHSEKNVSHPQTLLLRQTKTTPSAVQPLSRKEADQTDHGEIITFRCLRKHDVIKTPFSSFSSSCLGINCTAVIGSSSSTTSSFCGECGR